MKLRIRTVGRRRKAPKSSRVDCSRER